MRRTVIRALLLAVVGALLLTAAACGGDDDEAADTQAAAAATTDTGEATTTDEDEDEAETETSGDDDGDTPTFAGSEECRELAELGTKVSTALGGTGGTDLEDTQEFLDEFADQAPEEIRDDFAVIAEAYGKIAEAMKDVDLSAGAQPDPEAMAKLQELAQELDQPRLEEANQNITAWVNENCDGTVTTD